MALSGDWVKRENNTIVFSKPNISPDIFEVIVRYIYSELLIAADELILKKLIDHLKDYLIEHYAKELEETFATFHETSFIHNSFKKLQKFCTEIAVNNPAAVFNSQDFISLNKNALCSILSQDDLNIEESKIWEKIIEWGVAKLSNDIQLEKVLNWTDENFEAFKESIGELLPLIRFFNISSHYLVPGSHQESVDAQPLRVSCLNDSKLLQSHNIKQLDHWIQGKDQNTPLEDQLENDFKLLLRGSRDGFSPNNFHRLCDNKGATIAVTKVKGTGQLIGGYSPEAWNSLDYYLNGEGSFIFTLGDGKAQNAKLSKFISGFGPFCHKEFGPQFGCDSIRTYSLNFQSIPCSCIK
ncbi:hypothetical protein G9A89_010463 [Geosiphon pyriformis]|nr:hypothetical protein G9A89_010463 [Geosiphon pyriformis]